MKKLLFGCMAVAMLAACTNDEVVPVNNEANAIKFSVKSENSTRAADIYCSENYFTQFNVVASYNDATYIENDLIGKSGSSWENLSGTRYWPETGSLKFYGYVNAGSSFTWDGGSAVPTFNDFKVNGNVDQQVDLMYATQETQNKEKVQLNFRHALSQIVFQAKNTNANLYVEICEVAVVNVANKSTYTFPSVNTSTQIPHPGTDTDAAFESRGVWSTTDGNTIYNVKFATKKVNGDGKVVALTTYTDDNHYTSDAIANALILMPQTTTAFEKQKYTSGDLTSAIAGNGSYFLVKCLMKNVADGDEVTDGDVVIWPRKANNGGDFEPAYALIPVAFNWEQGKKYTYTFTFGNESGGIDPTNPSEDVLVPITYAVTIDDFVTVDEGEYDINGYKVSTTED